MEPKRAGENFGQVNEQVQAALEAGYVSRTRQPADAESLGSVQVAVWQEAYVGSLELIFTLPIDRHQFHGEWNYTLNPTETK